MRAEVKFLVGVIFGFLLRSFFSVVWGESFLCFSTPSELTGTQVVDEEVTVYDDGKKEEENKASDLLSSNVQEDQLCTKRYLLLTSQKSGSTWFCTVLHQQKGISCGGRPSKALNHTPMSELLIEYSHMTSRGEISKVTWPEYETKLDKAFAEVCDYNPATSIGFKLMYNQVPPQFIENGNLEKYLKENQVAIIHLVREAKILVLASAHDVRERGMVHHTIDPSMIKNTSSLEWNEKIIDTMLEMEKSSLDWQDVVHKMTPYIQYFYVAYENLLVEEKRKQLVGQIAAFVLGIFDPDIENVKGILLKQSESSCTTRIAKYKEFRAHNKVINSRTAAACDLINRSSTFVKF